MVSRTGGREMQCKPPAGGCYTVEWVINELVRRQEVPEPALKLWLHLKGLAWERGMCDPTDAYLAELMGRVTLRTVHRALRKLRKLHLVVAIRQGGVRWLVPLPGGEEVRRRLPEGAAREVALAEGLLRRALGGEGEDSRGRGWQVTGAAGEDSGRHGWQVTGAAGEDSGRHGQQVTGAAGEDSGGQRWRISGAARQDGGRHGGSV